MIRSILTSFTVALRRSAGTLAALCYLLTLATPASGQITVTLADQPIFASADVPGNLALTLSVEYPTAISVANLNDYADGTTYLGYFDPQKCYTYQYNSTTPSSSYFQATAFASGTNSHTCSGQWSGNFMNWATMQTIDPFRWALTGGYRSVDTLTQTILEKAWGSNQGNTTNFPDKGTSQSTGNNLASTLISSVTPFSNWSNFNSRIWNNGNMMVFSPDSSGSSSATYKTQANSVGDLSSVSTANVSGKTTAYRVYVRVLVCDTSSGSLGVSGLESNCVGYGTATTSGSTTTYDHYKPEGLMQQYSNKIRFAALSYLYADGQSRQGGVLREPMGFIGPTYPTPLSTTLVTNSRAEWDATTGIMNTNPDTTTASASSVTQSGVMNFLNKFGETSQNYMLHDNISELYYAAVRYYENLGNVPEWTNGATSTQLDGFPAVTTWDDPIAYSCQKNFILGIGDDHTWYDYNVGGASNGSSPPGSRAMPSSISSDNFNKASTWATNLQKLESMTPTTWWNWTTNPGSTYYIAGLAYGTHVLDIRSDLPDTQTISTYWMDVEEYQRIENMNPYYLAAKYGGFSVPSNYSLSNTTTPLTLSWYDTTGNTITMAGNSTPQNQPDNYFLAGNARLMVNALTKAFTNIANAIKAYTTSFSLSSPVISSVGETSFASQYDSSSWTSVITASTLTFTSTGAPSTTMLWASSSTLETQLAGTGWQTARNVVTWNGTKGVPFETGSGNLTSTQLAALVPSNYSSSTTSTQYLNYLRGDHTNEVGSTVSGSTKSLRARTLLMGDVVDAALTPVSVPSMPFSDAHNAGYSSFKSTYSTRTTMVYAAANDGMLHAFVGSTGLEKFAYIPSAMYQGPNGTPQVDGLAALGNPSFVHHYYVDATPGAFDVDFNKTYGSTGTSSNWKTLLIGGLGKGGKSFYAIDVTNPTGMTSETAIAPLILWEFTDSTMGYSYGKPIVVKTAKYGWVVAFTSGYDNSDGYGYLYLVNPATGALLEKIKTPTASSGLTQASAYVMDFSDYTADSIYVGDLNGQLWRFDLTTTGSSPYPAPTQIASLTDGSSNAQPITTAPLIEIHPTTRQRYIMVGTGQLLSTSDVSSTAAQTFYAIIDGTAAGFSSVSTPIARSDLTQVTDVTVANTISGSSDGWYYDLPSGSRVVTNPVAYNGVVAFATLIASTNACSPSGSSNVYALDYSDAKSVLAPLSTSTTPASYQSFTGSITNLSFVSANGTVELIAGQTSGAISQVNANLSGTTATRLLNWAELPTAE